MTDDTEPTDTQHRPAVGGPVEHTVGRPVPERSEPAWAQQCRECANLRQQRGGRIWKCMALRVGHQRGWPEMGYCADARAPGGVCGPEGRAYIKTPNAELSGPGRRR